MSMMKQMMERVDKLEQNLSSNNRSRDVNVRLAPPTQEWKCFVLPTEVICRKCENKDIYARENAVQRPGSQQGNKIPLERTQQNIQVSPITSTSTYKISVTVYNLLFPFIVDTGSAVTLIRKDIWEAAKPSDCNLTLWSGP